MPSGTWAQRLNLLKDMNDFPESPYESVLRKSLENDLTSFRSFMTPVCPTRSPSGAVSRPELCPWCMVHQGFRCFLEGGRT